MRIHRSDIQSRIFDLLGISAEEAQAKFGFLLDAFRYGAPPHAGFAFGIDRLAALLAGEENIREVIAFPKTQSGADPLTVGADADRSGPAGRAGPAPAAQADLIARRGQVLELDAHRRGGRGGEHVVEAALGRGRSTVEDDAQLDVVAAGQQLGRGRGREGEAEPLELVGQPRPTSRRRRSMVRKATRNGFGSEPTSRRRRG